MKRKTRRKIHENLNRIYKISKSIADDWGMKTIPLVALKITIDKSKPSEKTGVKELDDFFRPYNNTLDTFYETCCEIAKKMDSKSIPISEIKKGVDLIKTAYA